MDPTVLTDLGFSDAEARAYIELLRQGSIGAPALAELINVPRSSLYLVLRALVDRGLVEGGAGYGSRFSAVAPDQALPLLFQQQREAISRREARAGELMPQLEELFCSGSGADQPAETVIEVLRSGPAISARYDQLQLGAERSIDVFVKAPVFLTRRGNPAEMQTLKRRVRNRGLYEEAVLAAPQVAPYLSTWAEAGEEIRIYDGELPIKMAVVDRRAAFVGPLVQDSASNPSVIVVRHDSLGAALGILFDHLWEKSRPYSAEADGARTLTRAPAGARAGHRERPDSNLSPGAE